MAIPERTPSTTATISSSLTLRTPARSATSMGLNAGGRITKNGAKLSKKDRARKREEIERSWDVPGNVARNIDSGLSPAILGRPPQARVHAVGRASGSAASPSPRLQPGPVKVNRPNAIPAPVKNPELSFTGGSAAASPCGNESKAKSKSIPYESLPRCRLTARRSLSLRRALRSSRPYMVTRMASGRWQRRTGTSLGEVLTLIHVRCPPSPLWPFIHLFLSIFSWFDPIGRSIVRGSTLDGILSAGVAYSSLTGVSVPRVNVSSCG